MKIFDWFTKPRFWKNRFIVWLLIKSIQWCYDKKT